jgi:hypothetical protein
VDEALENGSGRDLDERAVLPERRVQRGQRMLFVIGVTREVLYERLALHRLADRSDADAGMLIRQRSAIGVKNAVEKHQLRDGAFTERRGRIGRHFVMTLIRCPVEPRQRRERCVLPLLEAHRWPAQRVETRRGLTADLAHALRLTVDVLRLDGCGRDVAIENAAHRAAATSLPLDDATSSSIHS